MKVTKNQIDWLNTQIGIFAAAPIATNDYGKLVRIFITLEISKVCQGCNQDKGEI